MIVLHNLNNVSQKCMRGVLQNEHCKLSNTLYSEDYDKELYCSGDMKLKVFSLLISFYITFSLEKANSK